MFGDALRGLREHRYRAKHPMPHWDYEEEPTHLVDLFFAIDRNDAVIAERTRPR